MIIYLIANLKKININKLNLILKSKFIWNRQINEDNVHKIFNDINEFFNK